MTTSNSKFRFAPIGELVHYNDLSFMQFIIGTNAMVFLGSWAMELNPDENEEIQEAANSPAMYPVVPLDEFMAIFQKVGKGFPPPWWAGQVTYGTKEAAEDQRKRDEHPDNPAP